MRTPVVSGAQAVASLAALSHRAAEIVGEGDTVHDGGKAGVNGAKDSDPYTAVIVRRVRKKL